METKKMKTIVTVTMLLCFGIVGGLLMPSSAMAKEITVKIGLVMEPQTLNPLSAETEQNWHIIEMIYCGGYMAPRGLYAYAPKSLEWIPYMAASMPQWIDDKTVVVKLKKGIKWHDGSKFTAEDVKFTLDFFGEFEAANYYNTIDMLEKVEVVDPYTLKFHLKEKTTILYYRTFMTLILQKAKWSKIVAEARKNESPQKYIFNYVVKNPVGTGPFKFAEEKQGQYILLEKNNDWFFKGQAVSTGDGGSVTYGPFVDRILFKYYGNLSSAVLALKGGEIDTIWSGLDAAFVPELKKVKQLTVSTEPYNHDVKFVGFNLREKPLNDKALRKALAYVIDKEFLVKRVLQNHGAMANAIENPGLEFWYNGNVEGYGTGKPEAFRYSKAISILKKAGYTWEKEPKIEGSQVIPGVGLKMYGGEKIKSIEIISNTQATHPVEAQSNILIAQWWKKLGIDAKTNLVAFPTLINNVWWENKFDAIVFGNIVEPYPVHLQYYFDVKEIYQYGWNMMAYKGEQYQEAMYAWLKVFDWDEARKGAFRLQEILADDLPHIPLFSRKEIHAYNHTHFTGWIEQYNGVVNKDSLSCIRPVK
ncbi:MAG: ABC transporter substrate-binding protein [Thermodesulfobacteriota bacterium]|nr:ABC transporter substrate-binding protein [Thermodesulfobacteriota bacterium]